MGTAQDHLAEDLRSRRLEAALLEARHRIRSAFIWNLLGIELFPLPGVRSAQVRACDDRAQCLHIGIPYKGAYALSSYALTYVALNLRILLVGPLRTCSGPRPYHE